MISSLLKVPFIFLCAWFLACSSIALRLRIEEESQKIHELAEEKQANQRYASTHFISYVPDELTYANIQNAEKYRIKSTTTLSGKIIEHVSNNDKLTHQTIVLSPDGKHAMFLQDPFIQENWGLTQNRYPSQSVVVADENDLQRVLYNKQMHVSGMNWQDNDHIALDLDCGSSCMTKYIIEIHTGQTEEVSLPLDPTCYDDSL